MGKAVVNGIEQLFEHHSETYKSHGSCGSVVVSHKSVECKTAMDVASILTLEQV